jgi:hypothetical protein
MLRLLSTLRPQPTLRTQSMLRLQYLALYQILKSIKKVFVNCTTYNLKEIISSVYWVLGACIWIRSFYTFLSVTIEE